MIARAALSRFAAGERFPVASGERTKLPQEGVMPPGQ
jgi:hypothetical protein